MVLCPDRLDVLSVLCRSQFYFPIHAHTQLPPKKQNKIKIKQRSQDGKFSKMSLHSRGCSCPTAMRTWAMCASGISMLSLPSHGDQSPLPPPLQGQQPHFGFMHRDTGSCGWRRGGGRDGSSTGATAECTAQRQNTTRGSMAWLHTRSSLNPLCIFGQMTLHLHIYLPTFSLSMRQWALMAEYRTLQCINFEYE